MNHRDLAQFMLGQAKMIIEAGAQAQPVCAMCAGSEIDFVMLPWRSPRDKAATMEALRKTLAEHQGITVYCLLSEAWMSVIETKDAQVREIKHMPRNDPNRKEILIVTAASRAGESVQLTAEIKTLPDGKRCLMQPQEAPPDAKSYGQMVNLFAPMEKGH